MNDSWKRPITEPKKHVDPAYAQQLELQLNLTREATPEECAEWEQQDYFRAGKFDALQMFVVLPTMVQLIMMGFMFAVFWFNANNF